ncbi:hypothetical protein BDZ85DRAFT_278264 [Elsinoe ampelina]|uniref:Uncharacterized protein n=1 Tax=Elsinoe ampelina TaxID=302913 RepID=A0A6A6GKX4_9PEZI|nr:hypothetical protein BDZ85DRAFT_278264 [Elsinoe ampelina]
MARQSSEDTTASDARRPSATASLQSTLNKDVELSLNRSSRHNTWRDSMSGIARSVLLKAKGSIDHIRGVPEHDEHGRPSVPTRSFSSARTRTSRLQEVDATPELRRGASLSLRRVLTTHSKSKRSSLLVDMMAKRSLTKLVGPEELIDEAADTGSVHTSPARASLRNLHVLSMTRSDDSSANLSAKVRTPDRHSRGHDSVDTTGSSPIPIPRGSPPPTIDFEIESGQLSPTRLFGDESLDSSEVKSEAITAHRETPIQAPESPVVDVDTETRNTMIMARRRSKRQAIRSEIERIKDEHIHIPRRSSNDHWRMRKVSRNRPHKLPEASPSPEVIPALPSPMPGTNLPLDDPFDVGPIAAKSLLELPAQATNEALPAKVDGAADPSSGLPATGISISPSSSIRATPAKAHATALALPPEYSAEAVRHIPDGIDDDLATMSPQALRMEIEVSRRALQHLEGRMADIEAELRKAPPYSPPIMTWTGQSEMAAERTDLPLRTLNSDVGPGAHSLQSSGPSSRHTSRESGGTTNALHAGSDTFSEPLQSPLEVQSLFYASDDEKAMLSAKRHLHQVQVLESVRRPDQAELGAVLPSKPAFNIQNPLTEMGPNAEKPGTTVSTPDIGSPVDFYAQRAEREQRYWEIFGIRNRQTTRVPSAESTRTDEIDGVRPSKPRASSAWLLSDDPQQLKRPADWPHPYSNVDDDDEVENEGVHTAPGDDHGASTPAVFVSSTPQALDAELTRPDDLPSPPTDPEEGNRDHGTPSEQRTLAKDVINLLRRSSTEEVLDNEIAADLEDGATQRPKVLPLRLKKNAQSSRSQMSGRACVSVRMTYKDDDDESGIWEDVSDKENER